MTLTVRVETLLLGASNLYRELSIASVLPFVFPLFLHVYVSRRSNLRHYAPHIHT